MLLGRGDFRLEIDGALVEFVQQQVVDGVDVVEGVVLERLQHLSKTKRHGQFDVCNVNGRPFTML